MVIISLYIYVPFAVGVDVGVTVSVVILSVVTPMNKKTTEFIWHFNKNL